MEKPPFDIQVLSDNSAEKNQARKTGLACMKQEGTWSDICAIIEHAMLYIVCFDPAQLTVGGRSAISCNNAIEVKGSHAQRRSANPTKGGGKDNFLHETLHKIPPDTVVTRAKN